MFCLYVSSMIEPLAKRGVCVRDGNLGCESGYGVSFVLTSPPSRMRMSDPLIVFINAVADPEVGLFFGR